MGELRQYTRLKDGVTKCILMELDGNAYHALLEDISMGGALIKVSDGVSNGLQVGDECSLTLCSDSGGCSSKHFCQVVRCSYSKMGIKFIT